MDMRIAAVLAGISWGLSACGGGSGDALTANQNGALSIALTDAPVDGATKVVVKFTAIEVKPQGGNALTFDIPDRSIDLLTLAGGGSTTILDGQTLPAGNYEWVRLLVAAQQNTMDSFIELNTGTQHPLFIPSGSESGLKLVRGFVIAAGGRTDFTIDFDLRQSIVAPPGQAPNYFLKPVLRLINNLQVGTLAGSVPTGLIPVGCTPFIYIFTGSSIVPDDIDPAPAPDVDPLASVPVLLDNAAGNYRFRVPFLEAGNYTAAFTCDGKLDAPDAEDTLRFSPAINFTVNANQTVTIGF